jgi:hypothetical protein
MYYEVRELETNKVIAVFLLFTDAAEDWVRETWPKVEDRVKAAYVSMPQYF